MLARIEVHKVGPDFRWIELAVSDTLAEGAEIVRLGVNDQHQMVRTLLERYLAKRDLDFALPPGQRTLLEEFFQEVSMAKLMAENQSGSPDLHELLPSTVIDFINPDRTSFRKGKELRVDMFLAEAAAALAEGTYDLGLQRLDWVQDLVPGHRDAFALRWSILRTWQKYPECIPVLESWRDAFPEDSEPRLKLGEMWLFLEQYQRARDTFAALLERIPNHLFGLLGLAQAQLRLGEDAMVTLRKASVKGGQITREMIERDFDFRLKNHGSLTPLSLMDIAEHYQIPLQRVMNRALAGVLPAHPPQSQDGLPGYDRSDLDRHYQILLMLRLEVAPSDMT